MKIYYTYKTSNAWSKKEKKNTKAYFHEINHQAQIYQEIKKKTEVDIVKI